MNKIFTFDKIPNQELGLIYGVGGGYLVWEEGIAIPIVRGYRLADGRIEIQIDARTYESYLENVLSVEQVKVFEESLKEVRTC